jgi:hypothetical protein
MWSTEHRAVTTADPETVWSIWADVARWGEWNADIEAIELAGPFAAGGTITMTPRGQEPIELVVAEAERPRLFVDRAELGGVVVRTTHLVEPLGDGRSEVTYRLEISGPEADALGSELGPAISGEFPETIAALVARAEGR